MQHLASMWWLVVAQLAIAVLAMIGWTFVVLARRAYLGLAILVLPLPSPMARAKRTLDRRLSRARVP